MRKYWYRIAVITLGCCLSIGIAMVLGLQNYISAGIIAILSIQDTKKETVRTAGQRLLAFAFAMLLAVLSFKLIGYNVLAYGLFLLPFSVLCYYWGLQGSLPICAVLASHFWSANSIEIGLIMNECILMVIGSVVGVGLNLFLPRGAKDIKQEQRHIESIMRLILMDMAGYINHKINLNTLDEHMAQLTQSLESARNKANTTLNNTLTGDMGYYVQYVDMRASQYIILNQMRSALLELAYIPSQGYPLADFLSHIADSLHELNNANDLLLGLKALREGYKANELPKDRREFEARAVLYKLMIDTEHFLLIKQAFVKGLTQKQKDIFFNQKALV